MLGTLWWFLRNPNFWAELVREAKYRFLGRPEYRRDEAIRRCESMAIKPDQLLAHWGFSQESSFSRSYGELIELGVRLASKRGFSFSGGANLDVLYAAAVRTSARSVIETGVAAGWSTLAILQWLISERRGRLYSVDRPYPGSTSRTYIGAVLPEDFANSPHWTLLNLPDRKGIPRAIRELGFVDLAHYDSDKSPDGRHFAYPLLYAALRPGGIFISDDIADNYAFWEFVDGNQLDCFIVDSGDKYLGVIEKSL